MYPRVLTGAWFQYKCKADLIVANAVKEIQANSPPPDEDEEEMLKRDIAMSLEEEEEEGLHPKTYQS